MLNKKVLVAAVIGTLFAGGASATDFTQTTQAGYDASIGVFAKEIKVTSSMSTTPQFSGVGISAKWESGYAFSPAEVRYIRIEAAPHVVFNGATAVAVEVTGCEAATAGTADLTTGAVNGLGSNVITFSVTAGASGASDACTYTLTANAKLLALADSNIAISLYDQPSQAQAGGSTGRIGGGSYEGEYIKFADSLKWVNKATTAVSDVEASPSFTLFTSATSVALSGGKTAELNSALGIALTGTRAADSTPIAALNTLLDVGAGKSTVTISGEFGLTAGAGGSFSAANGAPGRVTAFGVTATSVTAGTATFGLGSNSLTGSKFEVNKLITPVNPTIAASVYTAKLNAVAAGTTYNVPVLADATVGEIVRNGTELQAPLAQIPGGWISRLVLTNTSGAARPYTISLLNVEGETAVTPGTLTGTIPANGTKVINDLTTVFTGNNRATIVVNVAGPDKAIQGLYQIVNPTSGSVSNHVMVRPGSN